MSFHHTQADPAGWGRRTMRATGCAAALLLALTGCFGGSQSENSSSTPSPSSTANHSQYPLPSSTASPSPTKKTEPTVTETQVSAPAESAEAKASESSAPAEAKATSAANPTAAETPRAPEKVEAERASAGERCGHIGRKGYLKTGAEIMVLRGTVDCAHVLDLMTEYVTTTANTKRMNALNVVILPVTEGKQLTCLGEIETGSMTCHDGNGRTIAVGGRREGYALASASETMSCH